MQESIFQRLHISFLSLTLEYSFPQLFSFFSFFHYSSVFPKVPSNILSYVACPLRPQFFLSVTFTLSCVPGERERPRRPQQGHGSSADR